MTALNWHQLAGLDKTILVEPDIPIDSELAMQIDGEGLFNNCEW